MGACCRHHWVGRSLAAAAAALAAWPAAAIETRYYEWHEPNGTVVMSNLPPGPHIERYSIRQVDTPPQSARERTDIDRQLAHDRALIAAPAPVPYDGGVAAAQQALDRARHQRKVGRAPLPGERLHDVNGDSRLAPWYYTRQRQLDVAVARAESDLRRAYQRQAESVE